MADKRETPKKPVKRGRKPKEETVNDFCRLCNCALKRKFGDFEKIEYISTENLFKESNRKDCSSRPLAELCEELIETPVVKSDHLSDRVCKPCGRKVRNAHAVKQQVLSINKANDQAANASDTERFKHQLPTSVNSPDRSPRFRKGAKSTDIKTCRPPAKKTLFSQSKSVHIEPDADQDKVSFPSSTFGLNEVALSNLNIEELVESTSTEVKVVIVFPSGATETHSSRSFSRETTSLIVNCCREKWKAVANIVVKHEDLRSEVIETVGNTVRKEFKEYCRDKTDSILTRKSPEELASLSNKLVAHEVKINCPFWYSCLWGACNASAKDDGDVKVTNSIALASAVAARCRNQKMSAIAYRISTILFHSGVKHADIARLHKLGVCISADMIVNLQKKMGESCEAKVKVWKKEIERNEGCRRLLSEVKAKQCKCTVADDDMAVDAEIDFEEETINGYGNYYKDVYDTCKAILDRTKEESGALTEGDLDYALTNLSNARLPFYK